MGRPLTRCVLWYLYHSILQTDWHNIHKVLTTVSHGKYAVNLSCHRCHHRHPHVIVLNGVMCSPTSGPLPSLFPLPGTFFSAHPPSTCLMSVFKLQVTAQMPPQGSLP